MKVEISKKEASKRLFISCALVYMVICMTKTNYLASIAYIVKAGIFSKADSGIISAAFYLLYGISQILLSPIADRHSPYKVIAFGVIGTMITNIMLAFTQNFWAVLVLWGATGLLQFGVWPATARIMTGFLVPEHRQSASVYVTFSLAIGGILSYFIVTPVLEAFGWSGVFVMNVLVLTITLIFWKWSYSGIGEILTAPTNMPKQEALKKSEVTFGKLIISSGLFIIVFLGVAQSMLDNGVKTWVPTMMMESYNLSPALASIQTAALYIFNILGVLVLVHVFKRIKNPILVQTIYFLICLPACVLMLFIGKIPLWITLALLIISTTVTYAMTSIAVRVGAAFEKYGYSAAVCGLINAFVCFGIVIGNSGYGVISEKAGWTAVTTVWLIVCALAVILGLVSLRRWNKFYKE